MLDYEKEDYKKIASQSEDKNNYDYDKKIFELKEIIRSQENDIHNLKNQYVRLKNSYGLLEEKLKLFSAYQKLCNLILDKINKNPFSSLWFLYSVKRKMLQFYEQNR